MLSFQNLHQLVYNLSQVTSAVSSSYVRLVSSSVKKNNSEADVYCSKSFIKTFELAESEKIFKDFPNIEFGSQIEDIQWIFSRNVKLKITTRKSVNSSDLYISLNKNNLKNFYCNSVLKELIEKNDKQQTKLLTELDKTNWNESFIPRGSFDETKQTSVCGGYYKPTHNANSLLYKKSFGMADLSSSQVFYMPKRGFKTKRTLELEEKTSSGSVFKFASSFKNKFFLGNLGSTKNLQEKALESPTVAKMINSESVAPEEKLKLKVSFGEGYMLAVNDLKKPDSFVMKVLKVSCVFFGLIVAWIVLNDVLDFSGKRKLFKLSFGWHGEINPEEIDVTFSDVKGVQEVKEELMEIVEFLRDPAKFSSLGGKLPKGVLLVGPPGTGKTLLARAVAGEANVPFFHASGSEFDEIFVGEGARRVRNLFRSAKAKAPSIIFVDEIDCIGSKRKSTMLHPYANQTINQLLSEMDGFSKNEGVIVIGATNRKGDLDSALLRAGRFDVEVLVPTPDFEGRKDILELYMSKILCKDIDIPKLARATAGCTGADLEAIVNHAAIRAATDNAPFVTMEYLENAKDKIMIGPERKSAIKNNDALITAYHEGGHAIVAYFTEEAGVVDKITIVPRGASLGHTSCVPESDMYQVTKAKCMAQMDVLLGGRAAEELVFGVNKTTANASDDLDKATSIASDMVKNFGMSEKLGVRTLKNPEGEIVTVNQFGQTLSDQVDMEVKRLIQESYERSKNILRKHAKEHKLLAEALVKYKTLYPEDVKAILGDNSSEKSSSFSTMPN